MQPPLLIHFYILFNQLSRTNVFSNVFFKVVKSCVAFSCSLSKIPTDSFTSTRDESFRNGFHPEYFKMKRIPCLEIEIHILSIYCNL